MPEGDTLFRTAAQLRPRMRDKAIEAASSPRGDLDVATLAGHTVTDVEARGKHLLIHLDDRSVLHSHLGMTGAWHYYEPEQAWRKPLHRGGLVLELKPNKRGRDDPQNRERAQPEAGKSPDSPAERQRQSPPVEVQRTVETEQKTEGGWIRRTRRPEAHTTSVAADSAKSPMPPATDDNDAAWTVVCFSPKWIEWLSETQFHRHRWLSRLGPDLLSEQFSVTRACRRLRSVGAIPIGEAVMNQTIASGIGNVYKSEVLFTLGIQPFITTDRLADEVIVEIYTVAQQLMQLNLVGYPRRTRYRLSGDRLWVYGRVRQPCYVCGASIELRRQGDLGRTTYWCPTCQPAPAASSGLLRLDDLHRAWELPRRPR